jgi:hypothetical protein
MKHHLWVLLVCLAPLLLIFALPALGVRSNGLFTLLILACFVMHMFMLRGYIHNREKRGNEDDTH